MSKLDSELRLRLQSTSWGKSALRIIDDKDARIKQLEDRLKRAMDIANHWDHEAYLDMEQRIDLHENFKRLKKECEEGS